MLPSDPLMRILMPVKRRPAERRARAAGARHGSAYRSEIAGHGQECGGDELAARRSCVQPAQADGLAASLGGADLYKSFAAQSCCVTSQRCVRPRRRT